MTLTASVEIGFVISIFSVCSFAAFKNMVSC